MADVNCVTGLFRFQSTMKLLFCFLLIANVVCEFGSIQKSNVDLVPVDQDVGKNMVEIIKTRGYQVETHYVTTSDGYILTCFRIPYGKNVKQTDRKIYNKQYGSPVLLQHGLLDSSFTWVSNYEDQSLGFILADDGFDVWFGNNRGNTYGRNHTFLKPDDKSTSFWDFSWDQMASHDLPAMINYITELTKYHSIGYVGHSEGTIQMFAAGTSLDSNTNLDFQRAIKSINIFAALAPVAYVSNLRSKLLVLLANSQLPQNLYAHGVVEFLPDGGIDTIAPEICHMIENGCDFFLMTICGPSLNLNASRIQVYVSQTPAGTSTFNMLHWVQGILTPKFQKYDFGSASENNKHYGQDTPPQYDLSKMAVPTALFYGKHDYLADLADVERLIDELPKDIIVYKSYLHNYAHLDYTWAYNANKQVYIHVSDLLKEYRQKY